MPEQTILSRGIVSGTRQRDPEEIETRTRRIAGGLERLSVGPGDCVAILMRNDIAFLEATYAAATLGAYAVPVNWVRKLLSNYSAWGSKSSPSTAMPMHPPCRWHTAPM